MAETEIPDLPTQITKQSEDFGRWYIDVVRRAELADYSPVKGCMVIRPYGYAIWELMQQALDRRFKATGHVNAYFPLFIPESLLMKESEHVAGFAPQVAWVTQGGNEVLEERLVVRPTSETIIGHMWSKWIQSYRDLPVLMNQWNSVVRWELRTKLFLRTLEFYWQEGHTAHATREEAEFETRQMLDIYTDFAVNDAAIPVIAGKKSDAEKFAGADVTYSIEGMMGDGKALQSGTSHFLGQNFSQAFEVRYLDQGGQLQHCWTTSWGLSTRVIGAIIMVHGDDQGLVLPPKLAPYQAVIVPIYKTDEEKSSVMDAARKLKAELVAANVRVTLDEREGTSPGWKFNDWEMRGVPVRVELGPKDVAKQAAVLARRDRPGREGKVSAPLAGMPQTIERLLAEIQQALHDKALAFRKANTHDAKSYDELKKAVEMGFAYSHWCGGTDCEAKIKEETRATMRNIPMDQTLGEGNARTSGSGTCVYCGKPAAERAIFARAY